MNEDNTFNVEKEYERIDIMFGDKTADEKQKIKDVAKECVSMSKCLSQNSINKTFPDLNDSLLLDNLPSEFL